MSVHYIAGPMTGMPNWNIPAFAERAALIRAIDGESAINPHELHPPCEHEDKSWDWFMRRDIAALTTADVIHMLPDWVHSKGAKLEHRIAQGLGMQIIYPHEFLDWYLPAAGWIDLGYLEGVDRVRSYHRDEAYIWADNEAVRRACGYN